MTFTPTQQRTMLSRIEGISRRFERIEKLARQSPEERGAEAGAESGLGTEESIRADNERLKKQLAHPRFAAAFFPAQRLTFQAKRRFAQGLSHRRLSKP